MISLVLGDPVPCNHWIKCACHEVWGEVTLIKWTSITVVKLYYRMRDLLKLWVFLQSVRHLFQTRAEFLWLPTPLAVMEVWPGSPTWTGSWRFFTKEHILIESSPVAVSVLLLLPLPQSLTPLPHVHLIPFTGERHDSAWRRRRLCRLPVHQWCEFYRNCLFHRMNSSSVMFSDFNQLTVQSIF